MLSAMSKRTAILAAAAVAAGFLASAHAADKPPAAAATCSSCHGATGRGSAAGGYPRLAGQPARYLAKQLHDFKSGARTNIIMRSIAAGLSDSQIDTLAAYYSHADAPFPARPEVDAAVLRRGQALVERGNWNAGAPPCASCHGPDLAGLDPDFPALAGQYANYVKAQLSAWQHGRRSNDPLGLMQHVAAGLDGGDIDAVAAYLAWLRPGQRNAVPAAPASAKSKPAQRDFFDDQGMFQPPPDSAMPGGPDGEMIRYGEQVFLHTGRYAHAYVGNALSCGNCHLDRGRKPDSAPMWAAFGRYPRYRDKNQKVNTLADRIQGCFLFSMNGKPPPADSKPLVALETYFRWLATGAPTGVDLKGTGYPELPRPAEKPDPERGAAVFKANCALCHGDDGQGRESAGTVVFPPLWGPRSFNWGAGMHRVNTAAGFIKANMPYGAAPALSDQQAWDVAAFVLGHPRPEDPRKRAKASQKPADHAD